MVGSRVGQTRARMQPMPSLLRRAFSRLLESTPNYVEVTAVLAVALIARLLYRKRQRNTPSGRDELVMEWSHERRR